MDFDTTFSPEGSFELGCRTLFIGHESGYRCVKAGPDEKPRLRVPGLRIA
jgi:hypothetical protein